MLMRVLSFLLLLLFAPLLFLSFPSPYSSLLLIKGEPQEDKTNNALYLCSKTHIYPGWGYGYGIVFNLEHSFSLSSLCFLIIQSADHITTFLRKSKSSFDSHLFEFHKSNEREKYIQCFLGWRHWVGYEMLHSHETVGLNNKWLL